MYLRLVYNIAWRIGNDWRQVLYIIYHLPPLALALCVDTDFVNCVSIYVGTTRILCISCIHLLDVVANCWASSLGFVHFDCYCCGTSCAVLERAANNAVIHSDPYS